MKTLLKLYNHNVCTEFWVDHPDILSTGDNDFSFMIYDGPNEFECDPEFVEMNHYDAAELNDQHYDLKTVTDWRLFYNDLNVITKMRGLEDV